MSRTQRRGISFIELVLIVGIILLLLAFLVPAVQKVREAAARTQTINNLKQMGLAAHGANDVWKRVPPGYGHNYGFIGGPPLVGTVLPRTVHVHLMPYIEQDNLYKLFAQSSTVPNPMTVAPPNQWVMSNNAQYLATGTNINMFDRLVPPFQSPSDFTAAEYRGVQNFAANFRVFCNNTLPVAPTIANLAQASNKASWPAGKQPTYTQAKGHGPVSKTHSGLFCQPLPGKMETTEPWEGTAMKPRHIDAYDGQASIPRTFNIDGTSNVILFATRYAVCGTDQYGSGIPHTTDVGGSDALKGMVDAPLPFIKEGGGSFYWAPPHDTRGAFFGHAGANTTAHGNQTTMAPGLAPSINMNRPTFQLAPTQANCNPLPSTFVQSFDTRGLLVCLADASCRSLSPKLSPRTWNLAIQPNDGQVLPQDWNN